MSSRKFVNWTPAYILQPVAGTDRLKATVVLPISLPPNLRRIQSSRAWVSEKNACKDAALQAYRALYEAGFLDDNLLPIRDADYYTGKIEERPARATAKAQHNPWRDVAQAWSSADPQSVQHRPLRLLDGGGAPLCELGLLLPVPIPDPGPVAVYWSQNSELPWTVELGAQTPLSAAASQLGQMAPDASLGQDHTAALLAMFCRHRWQLPELASAGPVCLPWQGAEHPRRRDAGRSTLTCSPTTQTRLWSEMPPRRLSYTRPGCPRSQTLV